MYKISPNILNAIKCSQCEGYLHTAPVMLKSENMQICGKCFKILPNHEKIGCIRQIGFESIAQMLLFPCRYNTQGCETVFAWNQATDHETSCSYRYDVFFPQGEPGIELIKFSDDESEGNNSPRSGHFSVNTKCDSLQLNMNLEIKDNKKTPTIFKYKMELMGNESNGTHLQFSNSKEKFYSNIFKNTSVKIDIEGAVYLTKIPQTIYCDAVIKPLAEPIYDSIKNEPINYLECSRCKNTIRNQVYECVYGHKTCKNCRAIACIHCDKFIQSTPRYYCKNFPKGCNVYVKSTELHGHEIDCHLNDYKCLIHDCEIVGTLSYIKEHLLEKHDGKISSSPVTKKIALKEDESWLVVVYDNIFLCKYFYYEDFIQLIVEYIGPHSNASDFKYAVYIQPNSKLVKSASCVGRNDVALTTGVEFSRKELVKKFNFTYDLHILQK